LSETIIGKLYLTCGQSNVDLLEHISWKLKVNAKPKKLLFV